MTIPELEQQLLSLNQTERQHLADLLNQSLATSSIADSSAPPSGSGNDLNNLPPPSTTEDWNRALQQLQTPTQPQALAQLLQTWEDEGDEQDQKATWEFLHQALNQDRLSHRSLFP
jgi:hypothetical protein